MPTETKKEYTEVEIDQIRADAAEEARRVTALRCLELIKDNVCDDGPYIDYGVVEDIRAEFSL